jgi:hypothetical protein
MLQGLIVMEQHYIKKYSTSDCIAYEIPTALPVVLHLMIYIIQLQQLLNFGIH